MIQHSIQAIGPLNPLYTSPFGKHVHSGTSTGSLASIQPYCSYCMKTIHSHISTISITRYSFIQLSELVRCGENENAHALKRQQSGFEPGLTRVRVRCSTAELPLSTSPGLTRVRVGCSTAELPLHFTQAHSSESPVFYRRATTLHFTRAHSSESRVFYRRATSLYFTRAHSSESPVFYRRATTLHFTRAHSSESRVFYRRATSPLHPGSLE